VDIIKLCIISTAHDVAEGIFAVLYVSIMGLTRFYKTTVFLHLSLIGVTYNLSNRAISDDLE